MTTRPLRAIAFIAGIFSFSFTAGSASAMDGVNAMVTDGTRNFAEGVLEGYYLQVNGQTLCTNPYVIGKYVSCVPSLNIAGRVYSAPKTRVWIDTNGQLGGMDVVNAQGSVVCTGPFSSNAFQGPDNFIYCN